MQLFFLVLDLALVGAAALLLLAVLIRRGRGMSYLALALADNRHGRPTELDGRGVRSPRHRLYSSRGRTH